MVLSGTEVETGNSFWEGTNKVWKCWIKKHRVIAKELAFLSTDSVAVWEI